MRISDWSSDVCSSDLGRIERSFAFLAVSTLFVGIIGSGFTDPNPMRMPFAPFGVPSALTPPTLGRHRMTNRTRILLVVLLAFANALGGLDRKSNTSELQSLMRISYAVFCLKKKKQIHTQ